MFFYSSETKKFEKNLKGNVPSGTVIDSVITGQRSAIKPDKILKDFYLCSQKGLLVKSKNFFL